MTSAATDHLLGRFAQNAEDPFLFPLAGPPIRYGALWRNAERLAQEWSAGGLKPGDVVALTFSAPTGFAAAYLACAIGGFLACPILDSTHAERKRELLELLRPRLTVENAPVVDPTLIGTPANGALADSRRPFLIAFSSGSTGEPKQIVLSLDRFLGAARAFARLTGLEPGVSLYHVLPFGYMAGILNAFFAPLVGGATVVQGPAFSPLALTDFWTRPLDLGVNTLSLTPTIAAALCQVTRPGPALERIRTQIRRVQCTSAPIPPGLAEDFLTLFSVPLQNCYGMTEIGGPLTFQSPADAFALNAWSTPLPELEIELKGGDRNELWLRSPYLMLGYRERDGSLSFPSDERGFFDTGDLAAYRDGKLEIVGRKKDLVIRGGVNVAPARVEAVLGRAPGVAEVSVVGVSHQFWGEAIVAWVVVKGGGAPTDATVENQLKLYCREHLGPEERPDHVFITDALPRSFIGKVLKTRLREMAQERLKLSR